MVVKGLLSAAEGKKSINKHNFKDCRRRWRDVANEGQRNFLVNH